MKKYSVSLPEDLAEGIRERVGSGGFSSYVAGAVRRQAELDGLAELVAAYEDEHGPIPEEYVAQAEEAFQRAAAKEAEWRARQSTADA